MQPIPPRGVRYRSVLLVPALCCGLALIPGRSAAQQPATDPPPVPPTATAEQQPAPAPRLVVPSKVIDLGQVVKGQSAEARFELRNEGNEVLRILRAKPG